LKSVSIVPATVRDVSYVAANLRPADWREIECQMEPFDAAAIGVSACRDYAYVAECDGNPEMAFGAHRARVDSSLWVAWSFGTRRQRCCVPMVLEFILGYLQPMVSAEGAFRVEARALAANRSALRFLERIGGTRRCELPGYGKRGEDFILYDWTRETWVLSRR
jgi:hypothetical protein